MASHRAGRRKQALGLQKKKNVRDWPHRPVRRLAEHGAYMVTAGTCQKKHFFRSAERLTLFSNALQELAATCGWELQAWAVFSNHYHFVALAPLRPERRRSFLRRLHSVTAREVNRRDNTPGQRVWLRYWDTHLALEKTYFAGLSYVHRNAVHHGLVDTPSAYPWCSARWFERQAGAAFYKTIIEFPCDCIDVPDDYPQDSTYRLEIP